MSNKTSFKHTEKISQLLPVFQIIKSENVSCRYEKYPTDDDGTRGLSVQEAITENIIASGNWQNFAFTTFE